MSECSICATKGNLQYECNYCGDVFCSEHRLPEKHDCPGLIVFKHLGSKWFGTESGFKSDEIPSSKIREVADDLGIEGVRKLKETEEVIDEVAQTTQESTTHVSIGDDLSEAGSESYTAFEPKLTVGNSVDPDYESSPDVNLDGSIAKSEDQDTSESSKQRKEKASRLSQIWIYLALALLVAVLYYFI
jgi:Predicted nucleic acid binding protein containing the AN1-type Zn-finger